MTTYNHDKFERQMTCPIIATLTTGDATFAESLVFHGSFQDLAYGTGNIFVKFDVDTEFPTGGTETSRAYYLLPEDIGFYEMTDLTKEYAHTTYTTMSVIGHPDDVGNRQTRLVVRITKTVGGNDATGLPLGAGAYYRRNI